MSAPRRKPTTRRSLLRLYLVLAPWFGADTRCARCRGGHLWKPARLLPLPKHDPVADWILEPGVSWHALAVCGREVLLGASCQRP